MIKSLILKTLIILVLVVFFGGTIWQTINYIEDRIITTTVGLLENSEFVTEIREMIRDIAKDVIKDILSHGYGIVPVGSSAAEVTANYNLN